MQALVNALALGSTYVLLAIGLSMIYGILRIIHVAHAAVYTLGAFIGYLAWFHSGNIWLGIAAGLVAGTIGGCVILLVVYRSMLDRPRYIPLIASVGLFILAADLFAKNWAIGPDARAMNVSEPLPSFNVLGAHVSGTALFAIVVTLVCLAALGVVFRLTQAGLRWRAIASDRELAGASGINVNRAVLSNFAVGSALAGVAGVVVAVYSGSIFATMGDIPAYKAFVVVVLGGLGSVRGAVIAGYALALVETLLISNFGYLLPRDALAFLVLIVALLVRPQGLFARSAS